MRMDRLVGRIMGRLDDETVLMIMSDHGFKSFRRGVNLNVWLRDRGYLVVRDDAEGKDMLQAVDWSRTQAYAVGFGGLYLNMVGREAHGIVNPGEEEETLKREITEALLDASRRFGRRSEAGQTSVRSKRSLPRPVREGGPGFDRGFPTRLPCGLGGGDRRHGRPGLRRQRASLERRPQHEPCRCPGRVLRQSAHRQGFSAHRRHCTDGFGPFRRGDPGVHRRSRPDAGSVPYELLRPDDYVGWRLLYEVVIERIALCCSAPRSSLLHRRYTPRRSSSWGSTEWTLAFWTATCRKG